MLRRLTASVLLPSIFVLAPLAVEAEEAPGQNPLTLGAFIDTYVVHEFNDLETRRRPYTTQAYYNDEPNVNLAHVDVRLDTERFRGRAAFQWGNSVDANYAAEKYEVWSYVQEANLGYKITDKLWLDGGIYLSHIGLESWISRDNWNYTRSFVSEFSPYYQLGAKLSYQFSDDTSAQLHILRGWQNISDDKDAALGLQLSMKLAETLTATYNNFLGDENGTRFFHDFLLKWEATESLAFGMAYDIGHQQHDDGSSGSLWQGAALTGQYKASPVLRLGMRVEGFSDPDGVVASSLSSESFRTLGFSANVDYDILLGLLGRVEYRIFTGGHSVFPDGSSFDKDSSFIVASLSYSY